MTVPLEHPVVASVSGGKDSTALCLHLREQGIPYRAVHMDTGWEYPETDRYIREVLPEHIGDVEWITPPMTMVQLVLHKGSFPSRVRRWCTQYLKIYPIMQWMSEQYPHDQVINAVGIRAAESQARAKLGEVQDTGWAITWRPLLQWTEERVVAIHKRHGVPPNPLYLLGASRVGCWPCIFAKKSELRLLARIDPERVALLRQLEADVYEKSKLRYAARGETYESLGYVAPSFFALKKWVDVDGQRIRKNVCTPIDEIMAWARTGHGGRQFELFDDEDRAGCVRWGLCDV